jgi:hypothetical protein
MLIGIDFEFANAEAGSICGYGLAFEDGRRVSGILALHPERGGEQEREFIHGISSQSTAAGEHFGKLYHLLRTLPPETELVAHGTADQLQFYEACLLWGYAPLTFRWHNSDVLAKSSLGRHAKTGIPTLAALLRMAARPHHPGDDAAVALAAYRHFMELRESIPV